MERLYLTKVELKALQTEIDEFIAFYSDSFTDESINLSTDDSDKQYDMWHGLQDGPDDNGES